MSSPPQTPRWVKVLAGLAAMAVLALAVSAIAGVDHGPGRHGSSSGDAPSPAHTAPPGGHE